MAARHRPLVDEELARWHQGSRGGHVLLLQERLSQRPSWKCRKSQAQVSATNSGKNGCMNVLVMVGQAHWAQCGIAPLVLLRTGTGIAAVRGHAVQNRPTDAIMHWAVRVRAVQNRPTHNLALPCLVEKACPTYQLHMHFNLHDVGRG